MWYQKTVLISLKIILKSSLSRQLHLINEKWQQPLSSTLLMPFWINHSPVMKVFTDSTIKGRLGVNAIKTKKHLYDYLVFDSTNEPKFCL